MDKKRLFEFLGEQDAAVLFNLLDSAYEEMNTSQRRSVFGDLVKKIPPSLIDGEELLGEIDVFNSQSLAGMYYEPFSINSKNFMNIPEETEEWFEHLGDFLEKSSRLTEQGNHSFAVQCFHLLYELIEEMESGEEIVFAHELGSWMIPGDEKKFINAYISSLAVSSNAEEFTKAVLPLIRRDSYSSFINKVYSTALHTANKEQISCLKAAIKQHDIRIK